MPYILVFWATVSATFQNKLGTFVSKLLVTLAGAPPRWSFGAKPGPGRSKNIKTGFFSENEERTLKKKCL
jgi:hypothetical protein